MIKNIIFDIGRVLIEFEWHDYVRRLFGEETAEKVTAAMWGTGYWKQLDIALLTDDEILELFYSAGPEYKKEIREAFDRVGECVVRRDWAIPMIDKLKAEGYRVLYLSNYSPHTMEANIDVLNFVPFMDGGIFSCDVKRIKPDPEIFRILIRKYSLDPENCIFIDDNKDNVDTALSLGMHAIHFIDYDSAKSELEEVLTDQEQHNENT